MIGTNELQGSKLYEYADELVFVIGFGRTLSDKPMVIVRFEGSNNKEVNPTIIPMQTFLDNANKVSINGKGFGISLKVLPSVVKEETEQES